MSERPPRPTRADFVAWRTATTRWSDVDVYGHMNNARYFELIDTCVNGYVAEAAGLDVRTLPAVGVVAEVSCRYFAEVGYPEPVELGLACERLGSSSVTYRIGIFQGPGEQAAAEGRFVHVYVDNTGGPGAPRAVRPVPPEVRGAVERLLSGA